MRVFGVSLDSHFTTTYLHMPFREIPLANSAFLLKFHIRETTKVLRSYGWAAHWGRRLWVGPTVGVMV